MSLFLHSDTVSNLFAIFLHSISLSVCSIFGWFDAFYVFLSSHISCVALINEYEMVTITSKRLLDQDPPDFFLSLVLSLEGPLHNPDWLTAELLNFFHNPHGLLHTSSTWFTCRHTATLLITLITLQTVESGL